MRVRGRWQARPPAGTGRPSPASESLAMTHGVPGRRVEGGTRPRTIAVGAGMLDRFRGLHVLVVGDLMLDRYVTGTVTRISPEAPVPVLRPSREWCVVGGAGNVASNLVG